MNDNKYVGVGIIKFGWVCFVILIEILFRVFLKKFIVNVYVLINLICKYNICNNL